MKKCLNVKTKYPRGQRVFQDHKPLFKDEESHSVYKVSVKKFFSIEQSYINKIMFVSLFFNLS